MKTTHGTWSSTKRSWAAARAALVEQLRPLYLAEVARLAEELRPRFEAGELHGFRDDDGERESVARGYWRAPIYDLEDLVAARFGLEVDKDDQGDDEAAHLVLACSPSSVALVDEWTTLQFYATAAAAWDVLAVARARGYYTATPDEGPSIEQTRWASEALS